MRRTTKAEDRAFLAKKFADLAIVWKPGDRCLAYKGDEVTAVERIEGSIAYLENGDSLHVSKMRRAG